MRGEKKSKKSCDQRIILCPSLNFQPSTLRSKQPVLFEAEVAGRPRTLAPDDHMIQQVNLQQLRRLADPSRQRAIRLAG